MADTRLYDNLFPTQPCAISSQGRAHAVPANVRWRREGLSGSVSWHTDGQPANLSTAPTKVKWLLEPRDNHPENFTPEALFGFDVIFTHDPQILDTNPRARYYPLGGTRIHESHWGHTPLFNQPPSIVLSDKWGLPGHRLRHDLVASVSDQLDVFGPAPYVWKWDALQDHRFHVAIEAVRSPYFFTEHLLDPLLTMSVPIYWGADMETLENLGFDASGILWASNLADLMSLVKQVNLSGDYLYATRRSSIARNFQVAHAYTCPEDTLYRMAPELFTD